MSIVLNYSTTRVFIALLRAWQDFDDVIITNSSF